MSTSTEPILPVHAGDNGVKPDEHSSVAPGGLVARNHGIACIGEFVGTSMFICLALGGTSVALNAAHTVTGVIDGGASTANTSNLLYIAFCFGVALSVSVWIFFRVSGGLFNPAVTLAFVLIGGITPIRGVLLFLSQIAGAIAGSALAWALQPGPLLAESTLGGGASVARGFWIEFFMTFLLVTTILFTAAEKNRATFMAPLAIGMALFMAELWSVPFTGGSLNPARSLGPAVVNKHFPSHHWIYWIAPCCGAALAAVFYKALKFLKYESNLGPDCDDDGHTYGHRGETRARLDRIERLLRNVQV